MYKSCSLLGAAEDVVLMFDAPLAPLVAQLAPRLRSVRAFVVLTDKGHMPQARVWTLF